MTCTQGLLLLLWLGASACARTDSARDPAGDARGEVRTPSALGSEAKLTAKAHRKTPPEAESAGAPVPAEAGEAFVLAGVSLRLQPLPSGCVIAREGAVEQPTQLQLLPPCQVHRRTDRSVRVESPQGAPVALIESSRPHPELPNDCDTRIQAVRVIDGKPRVSEHVSRVASCPPFQWDLTLFSALFDAR